MSKTALEVETTSDFAEFEFFGRTWRIPPKRHLAHAKAMRDAVRLDAGGIDLALAEIFLSPAMSKWNQQDPDQFAALLDLDPDEDDMSGFGDEIGKALGLGGSGNSQPSSTSS